jgi:histidine triad (HIT) family protein
MASKRGERDRAGEPPPALGATGCVFCRVVRGELSAHVVYDDALSMAFLDHRPLFPGHTLVIPRAHVPTLIDLPAEALAPFFAVVQVLAGAVERALGADGSFVAVNNRISQSVPHLHVHVVPRRSKDGLKGFFWPRGRYRDEAEAVDIRERLRAGIAELGSDRASA